MSDMCLLLCMQESAIKVQRRLRSKPRHPVQQAADIVEQVLATDGDMYLQTKQHTLPWWQLSLLDVKLFLIIILLLSIAFLGLIFWLMVQLIVSLTTRVFGGADEKQKVA